jgi:CheY-like chemotaxis protein
LPRTLVGDVSRLRQVLLNLVGNAIKFTARGGVLVRAERKNSGNARCEVVFYVGDTGIGMSAEEMRRIFDDFAQANEDTARRYGGHGLGLSISRDLVHRMGGDIACTSTPGAGSEFSFILPYGVADWGDVAEHTSLTGRQISLALPDGPTRTAVAAMLRESGAAVNIVVDEYEISAVLNSLRPVAPADCDIIIDVGNAELLRSWLAAGSGTEWPHPHVWLLLAPEQRRLFRDLMGYAHAGYLLKPVRRRSLMGQLVGRKNAQLEQAISGLRARAELGSSRSAGPQHILLAEDDPVSARLTAAMLRNSGNRVSHVGNGRLALEFLATPANAVDLVILDMEMPDIDGLAATRAIRNREAAQNRPAVPIVALTANAGRDMSGLCLAAGMNGFLAKPFDRADLDAIVARIARRTAA